MFYADHYAKRRNQPFRDEAEFWAFAERHWPAIIQAAYLADGPDGRCLLDSHTYEWPISSKEAKQHGFDLFTAISRDFQSRGSNWLWVCWALIEIAYRQRGASWFELTHGDAYLAIDVLVDEHHLIDPKHEHCVTHNHELLLAVSGEKPSLGIPREVLAIVLGHLQRLREQELGDDASAGANQPLKH